jgi:hypothetical protein
MGIPCISVNGVLKNPIGVYDMFMALFCIEKFCRFICMDSVVRAVPLLFRYAILEQRVGNASPAKKNMQRVKMILLCALENKM